MTTIPQQHLDPSTCERVLALLGKEKGYYDAIYDITEQENGKLTRGRPLSEVMALLKKKKILVACIEEIETMLAPLRKEWHERKADTPLCGEIQAKINELDTILKKTLALDQKNQVLMRQQLAALKAQAAKAKDPGPSGSV